MITKKTTYQDWSIYFLIIVNTVFILFSQKQIAQNQQKILLIGSWNFKTDPYTKGEKESWFAKDVSIVSWDVMNVPGNWDLVNEYASYAGDAWYTRTFTIDKKEINNQIRLVFESVYNDSKVWINGNFVGENHLGYLPFHFNITNHINFNQENRITVLVNNTFKKGAFWNWGGIRRSVWLEITPKTRIEYQHIDAIPDLAKGTAQLKIKIDASNLSDKNKTVEFNILISKKQKEILHAKIAAVIPANSENFEVVFTKKLQKSQVELWHTDVPTLYTSTITLLENKTVQHTISDNFGIKKLELDGLTLKLNGESIRPVGFNLVPEDRFTGNTLPFERIKEDVDLMKSLGATFARLSHVSLPKEFLNYLDAKGIMVLEEVGLWGKDAWVDPEMPMPKEWLQRIVNHTYNHVSVVGYSLGNEIGNENNNPKVNAYIKNAVNLSKTLAPNHFAVYASNTAQKYPNDATQFTDFATINAYGGWGKGADNTWNHFKKPIFITEFGDVLNNEDPNLGVIPIEKMMNSLRNKSYVLGASLWTLNDYRSNYHGVTNWKTPASQNRAWGIVTTFRNKKRAFADVQKEFAPVKFIHLEKLDSTQNKAVVKVLPRSKLNIPANILRNYILQITFADTNGDILKSESKKLKTIFPGDESFTVVFDLSKNSPICSVILQLIDPQGYTVLENERFFCKPKNPVIKLVESSSAALRVYFEKTKNATEHYLSYSQNDSIFTTTKSIGNFIEIPKNKLEQNIPVTIQLIAQNNYGETKSSQNAIASFTEKELPPIVWDVKRSTNGVFIGFSVSDYDYLYEIEYGTISNMYTNKLSTKVQGVAQIPVLETDKPFYFKIRTIKQWGFASEWSQEYYISGVK